MTQTLNVSTAVTTSMTAAVLQEPGHFELVRRPVPDPAPGQVRVKLEGCGVCASNLAVWDGKPWFEYPLPAGAPGHEAWGRVDATGDGVAGIRAGDRVAILSDAGYAEYDLADASRVVPLPASLDDRPFPAEPLGCALNIFARSRIEAGQTVAIVGIGFLGALLTQLASRAGARVLAISRRSFAREVALRSGAAEAIAMDDHWAIIERVRELTGGRFCERVIEAVGMQWPLDLASALAAERSTLVIAGYHQDGPRQVDMQSWNWRGLDVINAHERDPQVYLRGMRDAVAAVESGTIDLYPLITHTYPLDRLGDALDDTRNRPDGFLKAVIEL